MEYMGMSEKRAAEAKNDLIGWMYKSDLFDLLGVENDRTKGEREAWNAFMETLGNMAGDASVKMRNDVEDRAQDFGNEREETGFRVGFHVAMRLCMEGMLAALASGAYNGTKSEYIGNSLEILKEYIGQRAEKLDMLIQEPKDRG